MFRSSSLSTFEIAILISLPSNLKPVILWSPYFLSPNGKCFPISLNALQYLLKIKFLKAQPHLPVTEDWLHTREGIDKLSGHILNLGIITGWRLKMFFLVPLLSMHMAWPCVLFFFLIFFYFWLHWVFVAACGLSLVATSGSSSSLWCTGFSLWWLLLLQSTGFRHTGCSSCGLWALEHGPSSCGARASCSTACGIFPDQGSNPCPLHWQADL